MQKFCNGDFDDCYPLNFRVNVTGRTRGGPRRALVRLLTLEIDHRHWYEVLPSCFSPMWFLAALDKIKCAAGPFQNWEGASELNLTIFFCGNETGICRVSSASFFTQEPALSLYGRTTAGNAKKQHCSSCPGMNTQCAAELPHSRLVVLVGAERVAREGRTTTAAPSPPVRGMTWIPRQYFVLTRLSARTP